MNGDGVVSILVSLSLLSGIVLGLRFNVRLLVTVCLAVVAGCFVSAHHDGMGLGHGALLAAVAVFALQVGYFVALLIAAMRLTEDNARLAPEAVTKDARAEANRPQRI